MGMGMDMVNVMKFGEEISTMRIFQVRHGQFRD